MSDKSVTARVRVEIEVRCGSAWNPTTTMKQITDQAITEAEGYIRNAGGRIPSRMTIVGKPVVTMVLATEDQRP